LSIQKSQYTGLSFKDTGYFSNLMCDYLDKKESLKPLYNNFPDLDGFKKQIIEKQSCVSSKIETRQILVKALNEQYKKVDASNLSLKNIQLLLNENTFTVTTGHQLNLFTGPLYFLYKILTVINLAKELKQKYPNQNFVPIYWLATEDHDFEEINYFNFKDKKIKWERDFGGAVGRLSTEGLDKVFENFSNNLGANKNATYLKKLFKEAYLQHNNLADATFYLANQLFKDFGLVIIDADNKELKAMFADIVKDELLQETCYKSVSQSAEILSKLNYKVQVNPREINLFYLLKNKRERIVFEKGKFKILNTSLTFSKEEISKEVNLHPDKFSPNVLMRPMYQERILPNLAYIGGSGELAYWFEMRAYFKNVGIPFPILLLRNSVLVVKQNQVLKLNKLKLTLNQLFLKQTELIATVVKDVSDISIDFSEQKAMLQNMFTDLKELSNRTDKSFIGAVNAQEQKQINGLINLENRLLRAQKRKYVELTNRVVELQNQLFPKQSLQERYTNFSELYLETGENFIPLLAKNLKPLDLKFGLLTI